MIIGTYISIITLNVNGLNVPTQRHSLAEWMQKQDPYIAVYKRPTSDLGTHTEKVRGMEKDIPCKWKSEERWSSNSHIRQNIL